ncbi:CheR methyltransferase, SAM binding domain [Kibdelosporangium aridum]|uniref:CheR methyltransferase, SAM binding domain n=1 Tax=Kibdelosporangium aridum TaxID=2030 RepID=A0A1W1ZU37_KIBAR|nr:CheR methyltransferase, SAM binding domain [Kibdelosporangium aridum]
MWCVVQIVDRWNTVYFDGRLSTGVLDELRQLADASPDALALADRAFRLMRAARLAPTDVSVFTAWLIGFSAPRTVPSAWSGTVPPVTMAGRHRALDEYVARNPWHRPEGQGVFVDIGCGFPPFTTIETAKRLKDWRVVGVDPSFGRYLVYDKQGAYACYDDDLRLRYYQAGNFDPDQTATKRRFQQILERLKPELSGDEVADDDGRLIRDPMRHYETGNLELRGGGIGEFTVDGGADVIRCMNVFMYFDHPFREKALAWAEQLLRPGGLFVCGSNWIDSVSSRYTVYRKEKGHLVAKEFAFSIDNIRPIELAPWYALHDDNFENLANAHAVGTIRTDTPFRRRFDGRLDALLANLNMCPRGADGYLGHAPPEMPAEERSRCSSILAAQLDDEGFVTEAVDVLRRSGWHAWRNHVGHVAMRPVTPPPLAPSSVL